MTTHTYSTHCTSFSSYCQGAPDDNKESATENGNNREHRVTDSLHLPCESGAAKGNLGVVSVIIAIVQLKTVLIHLHCAV